MLLFWMWLLFVNKRHSFFLACLPEQTTLIFTDATGFKEFTLKSIASASSGYRNRGIVEKQFAVHNLMKLHQYFRIH